MLNLGSRFQNLAAFSVKKGAKNQDESTPLVYATPTIGKLRLNGASMRELGVTVRNHVQFFDLGDANNEFEARFIMCKSLDVDGTNEGFKIGGHNYVSVSTMYNAMSLNRDGVAKVSNEKMLEEGIYVKYPTIKEGEPTGAMSTGSTKIIRFELKRFVAQDENGELIDTFSPDAERGLEPVAMYCLVNRKETPFTPGIDNEDAVEEID